MVVLICIPLIISDYEHLFMCLPAIYCLLCPTDLCPFFQIELYKLYVVEIKSLQFPSFANIFSPSRGCLFILLMVFICHVTSIWTSSSRPTRPTIILRVSITELQSLLYCSTLSLKYTHTHTHTHTQFAWGGSYLWHAVSLVVVQGLSSCGARA